MMENGKRKEKRKREREKEKRIQRHTKRRQELYYHIKSYKRVSETDGQREIDKEREGEDTESDTEKDIKRKRVRDMCKKRGRGRE